MEALLTRRYLLALPPAVLVVAVATGIPTDVLPNPWFTRMTPVRTLDLVLWPLASLAAGSLLATAALPGGRRSASGMSAGTGGGLLSVFAIGCPVCNKLVVLALGVSGALTYFAPLQPAIGVAAVVLPLVALRRRLAITRGCALTAGPATSQAEN